MRNVITIVLLFVMGAITGCDSDTQFERSTKEKDDVVLTVGIIPSQGDAATRAQYTPMFDYIAAETGFKYEFMIPSSYDELLEAFINKQVDLALFGGVTYVKANDLAGAVPLVLRDIDEDFTSVIIVRADHPAKNINDIEGSHFIFGSRLSTSGHLMPRYFLSENKIVPEKFFKKIDYSGSHDKTVKAVVDGRFDAGVANSLVVERMFRAGEINSDIVRIIWESPKYTDYIWAVQPDLDKNIVNKLVNSFLLLSTEDKETSAILDQVGAKYYLQARDNGFDRLRAIMSKANI